MTLRSLAFLGTVIGLSFLLHRYIWARLVRDTALGGRLSRAAPWLLLGLALTLPLSFPLWRRGPRLLAEAVAWLGYTWLGVLFYLVVGLLLWDLARGLGWIGRRVTGQGPVDPGRRQWLARAGASAVGLGATAVSALGVWTVSKGPEITRIRVPIRGLDPRLVGFRIVQLTDIHLGPTIGAEFLAEVVRLCNEQGADLVAITGDLVDGSVEQLREAAAPLADLKSRHGTYFVTGNHEYYSGAEAWVSHLGTLGLRVLANARERLMHEGAALELAGVTDRSAGRYLEGHRPDLARAVEGADPAAPLLLLAHQPKDIHDASAAGVTLQLSGHTHGGQLSPFGYLVRLDQPAIAGLHRFGETWLYVSRGTGYWGPAMRVGVPAEIAVIELVSADTV